MSLTADRNVYTALAEMLNRAYGFVERRKSASILMRIIAVIVYPFNRTFMTNYTTTIFGRIYYPDGYVEAQPGRAWRTLAHEGRHLHDAHGNEPWFSLWWLFPQILFLPALLTFVWLPWWASLAIVLACLAPWPAPGRTRYERNGYQASIVVDIMRGLDVDGDWYIDYMTGHFAGWGYYQMTWSSATARARVKADIARARRLLDGTERDEYCTPLIATLRAAGV